jgi:hypothetical protein
MQRHDDFAIDSKRTGNTKVMFASKSSLRRISARARRTVSIGVQLGIVGALLAVVACSERRTDLGGDPIEPPAFVAPDAGLATDTGIDLTSYCPSDRCPAGHTTCPTSLFSCDVDLSTDPNNCGECGNVCPSKGVLESYSCIEGRCVLNCNANVALNCDGVPDNGCETMLPNSDHCGACGLKCPADKPCIDRSIYDYACGCKAGETYCPGPFLPCVDAQTDDLNCGGCNNACPPDGDGSERPPNTYFGCSDGACGTLKCNGGYGDCDSVRDNGCEVALTDDDNCGACGNKCQNGMQCRLNRFLIPECMCPQGQTFCPSFCIETLCAGYCADLSADKDNCGACGSMCAYNVPKAFEGCSYGTCERTCETGWGDCNGNRDDGCETNIGSDPKNCGGCGIVCDGIAGQACVDGQCMVEPCNVLEPDAGGPAR